MYARFKVLGIALALAGIAFFAVGGYTYLKTQEGVNALHAFSAAQSVKLTYNDQGQLVDRGETAGADAIMGLLTKDWGFTVNQSDFNPNDPIVNTASEYMFEMATVAHHTLTGTQTVVLAQPVDYKGKTYAAGSYDVPVNGRYYSQFDRADPLDGPAREQAWTGTALGLIGQLGVGSVTASALQIGIGVAAICAALGAVLLLLGIGVIWATRPLLAPSPASARVIVPAAAAA